VFPAFGTTLKKDFPEVVDFCRLHDAEYVMHNPETNAKFTEKKAYFADPSTLRMLDLHL